MGLGGEGASHPCTRDGGSSAYFEHFISLDNRGVSHSHEQQHLNGGFSGKAREYGFQGDVQFGTRDCGLAALLSVTLPVRCIPGKNNVLMDQLNRPDQVLLTE